MEMEQPLLRVHEAARLLNVSKWTIYRWIEEGRLHGTKLGRGSVRIFPASIALLIDTYRTTPVPLLSTAPAELVQMDAVRVLKRR